MEDAASASSLSSSSESLGSGEEEEKDMNVLEVTPISQCRPAKTSPTHVQTTPVALDRADRSRSTNKALTGHIKAKACAIERAKEVQANLDAELPSFVKSLHPSHVSGEYRLGLPSPFCNSHLPNENIMVTLIDEEKEKYEVKYLVRKVALTVGWQDFAIAHNLVEGDALVFQLVNPTEFQVYILRAYGRAEADRVLGCQNGDARSKPIKPCKRTKTSEKTVESQRKTLKIADLQQPGGGKSGSVSEEVGSEVLEAVKFQGTSVEFKDVMNLDGFTIIVNGWVIDSEFSEPARSKYYELCCSQKAFLHDSLLETINSKLAAGLISQTIKIADDIRACQLTTSKEEFAEWDKNLGAFEQLGMNVGFLRARIKKLMSLVQESEGVDTKRYTEAVSRRTDVKKEIKTLKTKLGELEETSKSLDTEIEALGQKVDHYKMKFRAEVDAPW